MKKRLLSILLIIAVILAIFTASVLIVAFDSNNYPGHSDNVIEFLKGNELLNPIIFSDREIAHMQDVKFLFDIIKVIFYITIILFLFALISLIKVKDYATVARSFILSGTLSISFLILLYLLSLDFNYFFIKFHHMFFANDLWHLPESSMLVNYFPKQFFNNALKRIFILVFAISSATLINGIILRFRRKDVRS